ncbi:hypothetical protein O7600_07680 [Micromonospora sp. WMMA1998]|uniref:hypothetical protein n=1 Tax=Micromonospora sp. WMMA1998 TaxID=3015167 RepID=UPI00248B33C6|nr:hypothetical protein [Micromonospora sp. WMMA1998]WBC16710.1 hypothetical protein O7600_07680 [Micromonospora sp. WMMA1998]
MQLPLAPWYQRGYRRDEVDALLRRFAYELRQRERELEAAWAESQRIKRALRLWQSERADAAAPESAVRTHQGHAKRTTTRRRVRRTTLPKRLPSELVAGPEQILGPATHHRDTPDSSGRTARSIAPHPGHER